MRMLVVAAATLSACSTAPQAQDPGSGSLLLRPVPSVPGQAQFEGWLRYLSGEVVLYDSQRSLAEKRKAPHCVSGHLAAGMNVNPTKYEGQRVVLTGKLVDYEMLPYEDRPLIPRRMLGDNIVSNWCFGDKVLLIETIRVP